MIDVEFETPSQIDRLANFAIEKIMSARDRVLYVAFLFSNNEVWNALKGKVNEGVQVTIFAPPITSYSGKAIPKVFEIYKDVTDLASRSPNLDFYVCPLWWQKDRSLTYLRSLINVAYTLHAKLLVVDDSTYLPSSNFESARHFDICVYSDDTSLSDECYLFSKDLKDFSSDMKQYAHTTLRDMVNDAVKLTTLSNVETQRAYPFRRMTFVAPFYRYEPRNFVRQQIAGLLDQSGEFADVMFQHMMPDVKSWSKPASPGIMETLISKFNKGLNVRILAASGVTNQAAIRAEDAPMLRSLVQNHRIRRSPKVHAKFMCTDSGFLAGSMNINPSSLFSSHFDKRKRVDINPALHILLPDAIPPEYVAESQYGTIWQPTGYKSSVEVFLIQYWNELNIHVKDKLRDFFDRSWSQVRSLTEEAKDDNTSRVSALRDWSPKTP